MRPSSRRYRFAALGLASLGLPVLARAEASAGPVSDSTAPTTMSARAAGVPSIRAKAIAAMALTLILPFRATALAAMRGDN